MQAAKPASATCDIPSFRAPYAPADETLARALLAAAPRAPQAEARIDARATRLVEAIRARASGPRRRSRISCTPMRSPPRRGWR